MNWGHTIAAKGGPVEVTRAEFNEAFGVEVPDQPAIPDVAMHVWLWWQHLNSRRSPGFDGLSPISYSDIYHWSALTRTQITPDEIAMLIAIDDAYIRAVNTERKEQRERNKDGHS